MARQAGTAETAMEDYALRRIPKTWTWNWFTINMVILGVGTAMFQFIFGGTLVTEFGAKNTIVASVWGLLVQGGLSYILMRHSGEEGLNVDLLSRGMGFGFVGSAITSILYWLAYTTFFVIEGTIMGSAITAYTGIPIQLSFAIIGIVFIPLTIWGMALLSKFQSWSFILFVVLIIAAIAKVAGNATMLANASHWLSFGANQGKLSLLGSLGAIGAVNGVVGANIIVGVDIVRFAPKDSNIKRGALFTAFVPLGIFLYACLILGVWFAAGTGLTNPGIYMVKLIGLGGFLFIVLSQLRIGLDIFYGGSMCLANFFSRTLRIVWGRKYWAVSMVIVGTVLLYLNVMPHINIILTLMGAYIAAWIGILITDSVIVRGVLKLGPGTFEYRRPYLPDFNLAGVTSIIVGTVVGIIMAFGRLGHYLSDFWVDVSAIVAFVLAAVIYTIISVQSKGKYYLKQQPVPYPGSEEVNRCPVCGEIIATNDFVPCPVDKVWICSQCCMKNNTCNDHCSEKGSVVKNLAPLSPMPEAS